MFLVVSILKLDFAKLFCLFGAGLDGAARISGSLCHYHFLIIKKLPLFEVLGDSRPSVSHLVVQLIEFPLFFIAPHLLFDSASGTLANEHLLCVRDIL